MNNWNFDNGFPMNYQTKSMGADNELVELLWRNGQVVLHSQTTRKQVANQAETSQAPRQEQPSLKGTGPSGTLGNSNSNNLIQDDETVSWIQYPLEDTFDKEFCSNFFSEFASTYPIEAEKPIKQHEEKFVKFGAPDNTHVLTSSQQQTHINHAVVQDSPANQMPPPKFHYPDSSRKDSSIGGSGKVINFSQFSVPFKAGLGSSNARFGGKGASNVVRDARECSAMTVGSSHCSSNQVPNDLDFSRASSSGIGAAGCADKPIRDNGGKMISLSEMKEMESLDPTVTSSSGGSGSGSWRASKQSTDVNSHKRKAKDKDESECQSEAAELESAAGDKQTPKPKSARRSRAAEIHNLSERRRRDRINEKMKALQELIPQCNKTDKASMLDEAIEYLKSLQLQLQVMWMGGGMAPMMFPGVQHYMSRMGMGIGPPSLPNAMQLQRVPLVDHSMSLPSAPNQAVACQPSVLNPFNLQNQMQNQSFAEQYARCMNFHHIQNASQPMNMFRFGPQTLPQGQTMPLPSSTSGAFSGGAVSNDASRSKMI